MLIISLHSQHTVKTGFQFLLSTKSSGICIQKPSRTRLTDVSRRRLQRFRNLTSLYACQAQVARQVTFPMTLEHFSIPSPSSDDDVLQNSLSTSIIGGQANLHRKPEAVTSRSAVLPLLRRRLARPLLRLTLWHVPL